ncbi:MAG TPA: sigma factor, partial [Minicystis sp.]|nr:sigma factor [Minicystis sp.]
MTSTRRGDAAAAPTGALGGDAAALSPVVRAVVASVLGERKDHPDVEDCTHEAIRRAIEGRERLRDGEPLRPWVIGIARHVALDVRRLRRRALREEPVGGDGPASSPEL